MCVGIPMQVIDADPELARARCMGRNGMETIDTLLVGRVQPGDWLLTHLGAAREVIDAERARLVDDALDALAAALNGGDARAAIDLAFADLVNREPELPEHLRKPA